MQQAPGAKPSQCDAQSLHRAYARAQDAVICMTYI